MVKFTLKHCAYCVAVADHGGIAQAARVLNISQPAVAQALDKLEELYGLQLFIRHHAKGVELTPQGRAFCRTARALLSQAERAENDAHAIAADLAGVIRFGCFHTIAPFHLARIITTHRAIYPDVVIEASELLQDEITSWLDAGDLDLALTYDMSLDASGLDRQVVKRLKPFILLGSGHPLATRSSIRLSEMTDEPFVMFDGPASRDYFRDVLSAGGIEPPVAFNSRSMESVRCAVAGGLGFSLSVMVPVHAATYDGGGVVPVPIAGHDDPLDIVLVRRRGREAPRLIANFQEFCRSHFAETP